MWHLASNLHRLKQDAAAGVAAGVVAPADLAHQGPERLELHLRAAAKTGTVKVQPQHRPAGPGDNAPRRARRHQQLRPMPDVRALLKFVPKAARAAAVSQAVEAEA